jgi:hypothetical protein
MSNVVRKYHPYKTSLVLKLPCSYVFQFTFSQFTFLLGTQLYFPLCIQGVPGGKVYILGGHSIGHSKQKSVLCTCVLFRTVSEIQLFHCTVLLIRKRYYVLFLIQVFIVQVKRSQSIIHFRKSTVIINALCNSCEDMACCSPVQCTVYCSSDIALSRKPFGIG